MLFPVRASALQPRRLRGRFPLSTAIGVGLVAAWLWPASVAQACTCRAADLDQRVREGGRVFVAKVVDRSHRPFLLHDWLGLESAVFEVSVESAWRGVELDALTLYSSGPCATDLEEGERYLFTIEAQHIDGCSQPVPVGKARVHLPQLGSPQRRFEARVGPVPWGSAVLGVFGLLLLYTANRGRARTAGGAGT